VRIGWWVHSIVASRCCIGSCISNLTEALMPICFDPREALFQHLGLPFIRSAAAFGKPKPTRFQLPVTCARVCGAGRNPFCRHHAAFGLGWVGFGFVWFDVRVFVWFVAPLWVRLVALWALGLLVWFRGSCGFKSVLFSTKIDSFEPSFSLNFRDRKRKSQFEFWRSSEARCTFCLFLLAILHTYRSNDTFWLTNKLRLSVLFLSWLGEIEL
jgi:hypothetical protein